MRDVGLTPKQIVLIILAIVACAGGVMVWRHYASSLDQRNLEAQRLASK